MDIGQDEPLELSVDLHMMNAMEIYLNPEMTGLDSKCF